MKISVAKHYNASNWYWFVGEDKETVWSSKRGEQVSVNDDEYKEWVEGGGVTSRILSASDLHDVLNSGAPHSKDKWMSLFNTSEHLTPSQQAGIVLINGIECKSESDERLNGFYLFDSDLTVEYFTLQITSKFLNNEVEIEVFDMKGEPHTFDRSHFNDFFAKMITTKIALKRTISSNKDLPQLPVIIA